MEEARPIDAGHFRSVLGQYPTGVCVVAAISDDGEPISMIVGSFTSVSLDPPLVGFLPDKGSSSWAKLRPCKRFCVNILSVEQEDICRQLASKDPDKFSGVAHRLSPLGSPIVEGAVAWIDCEAHSIQDAGDHEFCLGVVRQLETEAKALPLLFFQGGYGRFFPSSLAAADGQGLLTEQLKLVDSGRSEMEALAARLSARCIATVVVADQVVILASAGQAQHSAIPTLVGQRLPFRPPTGSVFAAWWPSDKQNSWVESHAGGMRAEQFLQALRSVKERGYSLGLVNEAQRAFAARLTEIAEGQVDERETDLDELIEGLAYDPAQLNSENCSAVRTISAPIFDNAGDVAFALTIHDLAKPKSVEEVERICDQLLQSAQIVSKQLRP